MSTMNSGESLRNTFRRFDPACVQAFQAATNVCVSRTHYELGPEHLLLRLLDESEGDITPILSTFRVDRSRLRRALLAILDVLPSGHTGKPAVARQLVELLNAAVVLCDEMRIEQIRPGIILLSLAANPALTRLGEETTELDRIDVDHLREHFHEIVGLRSGAEAAVGDQQPSASASRTASALDQFTIDLTARASAGEIDPVFGRDHEIRQMIDIFSRRRKNNPILVGEPGTGKTAIVEGLAVRIARKDVPPSLQDVRLLTLDLGLLQAGASVKGEFENRLKNVIREIKASTQPVITFIDEAHTLIGAGGAAGGGDAANLLKPALARGELRTVAATTWAEYKKYFEKDAALERRFQLVRCDEPSVETTTVILRGIKSAYEAHHKVVILDEAVVEAARLSDRYISGRFLPDKAVDLLDTASARVAVALSTTPGPIEDLNRAIINLDTAISALNRDTASGIASDAARLAAMGESRTRLVNERTRLENQWKEELAAAHRLIELRGRLHDQLASASPGGNALPEPDRNTAGPPADSSNRPAEDLTELRTQIEDATRQLATIQGEHAMVFPHVDASCIATIVSDWTGIPVGRMVKDDIASALTLESRLADRVVGQNHALTIVANKLRAAKAGLGNPAQPLGVFLCVGPSGVGKTELAQTVAEQLFGGERSMITINMSEFMEQHTVSQLKGSPPGYVGYGEGGVLTEAVRQKPYSVVLLDEAEKAHPDVLNLFYQVFDKGTLADGEGREINFKNTVLFLTSNLGTDVIQAMCEGDQSPAMEEIVEAIYPHLRQHFKPALLARMTVIPFFTLGMNVLKEIAKIKLAKLGSRLSSMHGIAWNVEEAVFDHIASQCTQVDLGARNIDHLLDKIVLPVLSQKLLGEMTRDQLPGSVTMGLGEDGAFQYQFAQ